MPIKFGIVRRRYERRMRAEGRISKVRNPSPDHAEMRFAAPRTTLSFPIPRGRNSGHTI